MGDNAVRAAADGWPILLPVCSLPGLSIRNERDAASGGAYAQVRLG